MELRRIGLLMGMLAVVGLLVLVLRGPLATLLEGPIMGLWWLVNSVPQQVIWVLLALVGSVVAFSLGPGPRREGVELTFPSPPRRTQAERLSQLIELAEASQWARGVLGRRLTETTAGLRALREGRHLDEVREEIRSGRWPANPVLAAVLQPDGMEEGNSGGYAQALAHALHALERYSKGGAVEAS
ncbi:MAG: hypothetical protein ACLFVD_03115 [Dehalococcoidia bacterium]